MNINLNNARHADQILRHYITLVMRAAGRNVDSDTYSELENLITDAVNSAVKPLAAKIDELEKRLEEEQSAY